MNAALVDEAVQAATANESTGSKVVLLRRGYIVAEWAEPKRLDMTFSVTKTFSDDDHRPGVAARAERIDHMQGPLRLRPGEGGPRLLRFF
jgi:hypothetical protein